MKRRLLALLLITSLAVVLPARAQDGTAALEGAVRTAAGEPLPGASVLIEGTQRGAAADADAHFEIADVPAGTYTVRASHVGYTSQAKAVTVGRGATQAVRFVLKPEAYSTGEGVVVTATRTEQAVSTAPASISVVSGAELQEEPVADLTDAIRGLPGVYISGAGGQRSISIRGLSSGYTLILVDGKRISSQQLIFRDNDFDLNQVPVSHIERIEVVRGSMSALYGSEALGGVINIITKPVAEEWSGSVGADFQTPFEGDGGQEYRTSTRVSGPLVEDALSLTLSGGVSRRNAWYAFPDTPVTGRGGEPIVLPDGSELSQADLTTQGARSDYSGRATLTWTPTEAQTVEAEYGLESQTRRSQRYTRSYFDSESRVMRHKGTLRHEGDWGWGDSQVKAYGERITLENGANATNMAIDGNVNTSLAFNTLTVGAEARWAQIDDNPDYQSGSTGFHQQALYAQDQIRLPAGLKVLLGGRLDNHENFGTHFTPRGYLVWSATDALVFKGGVGTAFKAPSLTNLTTGFQVPSCQGACVIVGNPDLEPETSTNYEVSANYSGNGWGASLTGYHNAVDNLINRDLSDAGQIGEVDGRAAYTFVNVAEATIQGLEATARTTLFDALRLRGNYSYIDAQDVTEDRAVAYQPSHLANAEVSWLLPHRTSVRLRGQYIGEQVFYSRGGASGSLEAYAIFDLGFTHGLTESVSINGGILNLADRRLDEESVQSGFVERGRSAYLGLNVQF